MKNSIVIFGAGYRGKKLKTILQHYGMEIKYWLDSDSKKWNTELEQICIYSPIKIREDKNIHIYISPLDENGEIYHTLLQYGVEPYRIHSFYNAIVDCVYEHFEWNEKVNLGKKQNIIFDCYNGLPLGGVEAWSISLLHEFVNTDREAYLLSPYGEYNISSDTKKGCYG